MKGLLTFTVQVWQTDVQVHFYFPSAVFVWVIHVELIHSGGQKHRWVQAQGCLPQGKPNILHGEGEKETEKRKFGCVMATIEVESRESSPGWNGGTSGLSLASCLGSAGGFKQVLHQQKTKLLLCVSCILLYPEFSEVLQTKTNAEELAAY